MRSWPTSVTRIRTTRSSRARRRTSPAGVCEWSAADLVPAWPAHGCVPGRLERGRPDVAPDGQPGEREAGSPRCQGSITIVKVLHPSSETASSRSSSTVSPRATRWGRQRRHDRHDRGGLRLSHRRGVRDGRTDLRSTTSGSAAEQRRRRRRGQRRASVGPGEAQAGGRLHDHEHAQGGKGGRRADARVRRLPPWSPRRRSLGLLEPGRLSGHSPARERQRFIPGTVAPRPAERVPAGTAASERSRRRRRQRHHPYLDARQQDRQRLEHLQPGARPPSN